MLDTVFLVLAGAEWAFDLDVGALLERGGEIGELFAPDDGAVPFGVGLPFSVLVFPGRLGGEREGSVGDAFGGEALYGILTEKADESESIDYVELELFPGAFFG